MGTANIETRFATSRAGHRIAYDRQGAGDRCIVLVCGTLMNRRRWHQLGYVERLAAHSTVITIDPLGHGASDKPHESGDYAPTELVDHLTCVLDAEESERAVVWGYSRGARIASMVALAHPSRIDLVVLGGAPIGMPPAFAAAPAQLEALEQGDWERHWQVFPVPLPAAITGAMEQGNDPRAIGAALRAWSVDDTPWSPLPVPAIGHLGDGEVFLDTALDRARAIGIPLAVLPTGGHAETFAASTDVLAATEPYLIR